MDVWTDEGECYEESELIAVDPRWLFFATPDEDEGERAIGVPVEKCAFVEFADRAEAERFVAAVKMGGWVASAG